jgi:glyoxylase-like metal-dependent hydrolase (beta-lactamase superfamily II)
MVSSFCRQGFLLLQQGPSVQVNALEIWIFKGVAYYVQPSADDLTAAFIHLREYLENFPIPSNRGAPLNPKGARQYIIICTHCHYDHTGGITQFLQGGTTEIVASAAGRDFIESDLEHHGLYDRIGIPAPYYVVTKWAQAFERLRIVKDDEEIDLVITIFQTVGHTPDELAWYDHDEMHLYVGDSFYREGPDGMPIIFPAEGSMVEWIFAMQKLAVFTRTVNAKEEAAAEGHEDDGWVNVPRRVLVSCAHQTVAVDGAEILAELEAFSYRALLGKVPVVKSEEWMGEVYDTWRETGKERTPMSIKAPRRLMRDCRKFFGHEEIEDGK